MIGFLKELFFTKIRNHGDLSKHRLHSHLYEDMCM